MLGASRFPALAAPLEQGANYSKNNPEKEKTGRHHIRKDADIGIAVACKLIDREEKEKGKDRTRHEHQPSPTDPVAKVALKRRHRGIA